MMSSNTEREPLRVMLLVQLVMKFPLHGIVRLFQELYRDLLRFV